MLGEVEWTDNNVRGLVVVRNVRNVVAARRSLMLVGRGHLGNVGVVRV